MVGYTLEGNIYQGYAWDQSQLRFLSIVVNTMCRKDSRFQVFIRLGFILHHYSERKSRTLQQLAFDEYSTFDTSLYMHK
jgi:hypothetical protein